MTSPLRDFLEIPYDELEELNLQMKALRLARTPVDILREERCRYLADEKRIKAVTVCFADLEGRLHMLDYDKKFLLKSADNLTFDGSSIRGFHARRNPICAWQSIGRHFTGCRRTCSVRARYWCSVMYWSRMERRTAQISVHG
jgi:hypothetical protein